MKKAMGLLILSFVIVLTPVIKGFAQELKLKEEKEINLTNENVFFPIIDASTGKYLLVCHITIPNNVPGHPPKDSLRSFTRLVDNQNHVIDLEFAENCIRYSGDTLTTYWNSTEGAGCNIRLYHIANGESTLLYSRSEPFYTTLRALKNGNYLLDDDYETSQSKTALVNSKFELINEIRSAFDYYSSGNFDDDGKSILFINQAQNTQDSTLQTEILHVDAITGVVLNKLYFPLSDRNISSVKLGTNCYYVNLFDHSTFKGFIEKIKFDGSKSWEINEFLDPGSWFECAKNDMIFFSNVEVISCRKVSDGSIIWQLEPTQFDRLITAKTGETSVKNRGNVIYGINIINSLCEIADSGKKYYSVSSSCNSKDLNPRTLSTYISIISEKGETYSSYPISEEYKFCKLFNVKDELWVLTNKKLRRYEINKNNHN